MTERTALYRLLAANGRLLYVGISGNPDFRWGTHSNRQPWWGEVADRKVEWFPTREAAAFAEVQAIRDERPLYNKQHATREAHTIPGQREAEPSTTSDDHVSRLPQDVDAEQSTLGCMLLSRTAAADVLALLGPDDFLMPAHQSIYQAIVDLVGEGEASSPVTVGAELVRSGLITMSGGLGYLRWLAEALPSPAGAAYYAQVVRERAVMRRLVEAGERLTCLSHSHSAETIDALQAAESAITAALRLMRAENHTIVSSALGMRLLSHAEVYGNPEQPDPRTTT